MTRKVRLPPTGSCSAGNISLPQMLHAATAVMMPAKPWLIFWVSDLRFKSSDGVLERTEEGILDSLIILAGRGLENLHAHS